MKITACQDHTSGLSEVLTCVLSRSIYGRRPCREQGVRVERHRGIDGRWHSTRRLIDENLAYSDPLAALKSFMVDFFVDIKEETSNSSQDK